VVKAKQDFGIGTDLKQQVLDNCTAAGATKLLSEVHRNNLKMRRVNEKLGIPSTQDPDNGRYYFYSARLIESPDDEAPLEDLRSGLV